MKTQLMGFLAAALLHGAAASASPAVGQATVTGPVTGGNHGFPGTATPVPLADYGYVEEEFFLSGVATSYQPTGTWGSDGQWSIAPAATAPYTTRILVRRPLDPQRFNGTVVVEWLNVSGNVDADVDFGYMRNELLRGYAWVGVSAQAAGIHGTVPVLGPAAVGLKAWDPARYGALNHPGDAWSYDVFSQAGAALVNPQGDDPLGGLHVQHLLAMGQSQSAFRLLTYANAVQPVAGVYDAILIHSRNGSGAPLATGTVTPAPARVRTDLAVPVFQLQAETDLFGLSGGPGPFSFPAARQADTPLIRTWEVAGTAHSDLYYVQYLYAQGIQQYGIAGFLDLRPAFAVINSGPQHYVANAALRSTRSWVATGAVPATAPPIETAGGAIVRDVHGNALGGVRTPQLDVPVATLTGEGARLNGRTIPFDAAKLDALYPNHGAYVSASAIATQRTLKGGFILPEGAREMRVDAAESSIGH